MTNKIDTDPVLLATATCLGIKPCEAKAHIQTMRRLRRIIKNEGSGSYARSSQRPPETIQDRLLMEELINREGIDHDALLCDTLHRLGTYRDSAKNSNKQRRKLAGHARYLISYLGRIKDGSNFAVEAFAQTVKDRFGILSEECERETTHPPPARRPVPAVCHVAAP